jgi:uncharacterized phage infection (PIP) family protein YhgE
MSMPNSGMTDAERIIELQTQVARLSERTHAQNNAQHGQQALVEVLRDIKAGQTAAVQSAAVQAVQAAQVAAAAQPVRKEDIPAWTKWLMVCGTLLAIMGTIGGAIWAVSGTSSTVAANLAALNSWKIEQTTANLPARMQNLETSVDTARRLRDQQQQSTSDRMRALEISDQAGAERLNSVLQQLATITAQLQAQASRIEELLRRQDRLENRLGARPGANQPADQPTSFMLPLLY